MANIHTYDAPVPKIKLNPDERGYAAWETAGRRVGPLYNQSATTLRQRGRLASTLINDLVDKFTVPEATVPRAGGGGFNTRSPKQPKEDQRDRPSRLNETSRGPADLAGMTKDIITPPHAYDQYGNPLDQSGRIIDTGGAYQYPGRYDAKKQLGEVQKDALLENPIDPSTGQPIPGSSTGFIDKMAGSSYGDWSARNETGFFSGVADYLRNWIGLGTGDTGASAPIQTFEPSDFLEPGSIDFGSMEP